MNQAWILVIVGLFTGVYSGLMGLGGGTVMIPIMVLLLSFTQHKAVGTSLAVMLPPVTLPAVIKQWRDGNVDIRAALWIALGVACGTYLGSVLANILSDRALKLIFGFVLIYVAGYTIFNTLGRQFLIRSMIFSAVMVLAAAAFFLAVRWYDARAAI